MTGDLIKWGNLDTETQTGRTPCEDEGRGQHKVAEAKEQDCQQNSRSYKRGMEQILLHKLPKEPTMPTP